MNFALIKVVYPTKVKVLTRLQQQQQQQKQKEVYMQPALFSAFAK